MCIVPNWTNTGPEPALSCAESRNLFGEFLQLSNIPPISPERVQTIAAMVEEILRARQDFVELDDR